MILLKKQKYIILIIVLAIGVSHMFLGNLTMSAMLSYYLLHIATIVISSPLKHRFRYPSEINYALILVAMLLPLLNYEDVSLTFSIKSVVVAIVLASFLLSLNIKFYKDFLAPKSYYFLPLMRRKDLITQLVIQTVTPIAEELFFRQYLLVSLKEEVGVTSIFVTTLMFTLSHYCSRWATYDFNFRSYISLLFSGFCFGGIMYYFDSLPSCILAHYIFNAPLFVSSLLRYRYCGRAEEPLFDDY